MTVNPDHLMGFDPTPWEKSPEGKAWIKASEEAEKERAEAEAKAAAEVEKEAKKKPKAEFVEKDAVEPQGKGGSHVPGI